MSPSFVDLDPEVIAIKAVQFLSDSPKELGAFLVHAGIGPQTLKDVINTPEFLGGVLDFMVHNEALLLTFSETLGVKPQDVIKARLSFPGGEEEFKG